MPTRVLNHRSCCNCCHIKHGTSLMGLLELAIACVLLFFTVERLIKRHETRGQCFSSYFANCRFNVSISKFKFDITLTGDYISAALMCLIVLAIILLFYGIYTTSAKLLLPHLIIQGLCLVFSLLYFFAYAWAYFYDDLYVLQRPFQWKSFFERMWLVSILLVLACFQFYLFFIVVNCAVYLQNVRAARIRKQRQWSEASAKSLARKISSPHGAVIDFSNPASGTNIQQPPSTTSSRKSTDSTSVASGSPPYPKPHRHSDATSLQHSGSPSQYSSYPKKSSLDATRPVSPLTGQGHTVRFGDRPTQISPLAIDRNAATEVPPQAVPHHLSHHHHRQPHHTIVKRISDESMSLPRTPPPIPRIKILAADGSASAPVKKVSISAVPSIRSYDPDPR